MVAVPFSSTKIVDAAVLVAAVAGAAQQRNRVA